MNELLREQSSPPYPAKQSQISVVFVRHRPCPLHILGQGIRAEAIDNHRKHNAKTSANLFIRSFKKKTIIRGVSSLFRSRVSGSHIDKRYHEIIGVHALD